MNTLPTLYTFVNTLSNGFTTTQDCNDNTITVCTDDAPECLKDIICTCHDGLLPNNVIYDIVDSVICSIANDLDRDDYSLDDVEYEYQGTEITTYDMKTFNHFEHYADLALAELGGSNSISNIIDHASYILVNEIFHTVKSEIESLEYTEWENV